MKLNFTIELPCKDHENCYNLEFENGQNTVNYVMDGVPEVKKGVTTFNLGQVTNMSHYRKINITD